MRFTDISVCDNLDFSFLDIETKPKVHNSFLSYPNPTGREATLNLMDTISLELR